ncbi:histone-lysine N-methyltransferase SETMAR [Trichonephila clavipes]|nr:histone-lysine N-methyltransferase SETMAR [Trichonephila clavipes]
MSVLIENPAACEIRCIIRFLNAKKVKPIEIYRQICEVYGQNAMSDSMVRRWIRQFNEGRSEVHDEERSGRPSLFTEELVHAIDEKIKENRDETLVSYDTPESKRQSIEWRHTSFPTRFKPKHILTPRKIMCTVFWDSKGILLMDFLPRGQTINAAVYCETLRKLRWAIQNKRRGFLSKGVFLHYNAQPHTANVTKTLLREFGWDVFEHPPYSPDLAVCDFHLFLHLKSFLACKHFSNDKELKENVSNWLKTQAATFYEEDIEKLVPRYNRCLQNFGSYVERLAVPLFLVVDTPLRLMGGYTMQSYIPHGKHIPVHDGILIDFQVIHNERIHALAEPISGQTQDNSHTKLACPFYTLNDVVGIIFRLAAATPFVAVNRSLSFLQTHIFSTLRTGAEQTTFSSEVRGQKDFLSEKGDFRFTLFRVAIFSGV